eukprot:Skav201824  [mRNA]  locus=scaffold1071:397086:402945:- [translate_table: standard]
MDLWYVSNISTITFYNPCINYAPGYQEILDYIMGFSAEGGNLDGDHPAQSVLDLLCGANGLTYATQLESFFEAYADMRGIKSKMFKPLSSCVDPAGINYFCGSQLWRDQFIPTPCRALDESQFVIPGAGSQAISSAEGRRNYTDVQETAQWNGGVEFPKAILTALTACGGDPKTIVLANATLYDGCVEKVCIEMGITSCSQSEKQGSFSTGLMLVKDSLLESWKKGERPLDRKTPRYQPQPPQHELPLDPAEPELKLCSLVDGCLVLPRDVRTEFMTDPVRAPEWRKVVQEFDRCFAVAAPAAAAQESGAGDAAATASGGGNAGFDWSAYFANEPRAKAAFQEKYGDKIKGKCQWCPQLTAYLVDPGDSSDGDAVKYMLFVEASEAYTIPVDEAFLTYGAGSWLLDSKVDSYLEENATGGYKGVMCKFTSDTQPVVFEDKSLTHG